MLRFATEATNEESYVKLDGCASKHNDKPQRQVTLKTWKMAQSPSHAHYEYYEYYR